MPLNEHIIKLIIGSIIRVKHDTYKCLLLSEMFFQEHEISGLKCTPKLYELTIMYKDVCMKH